MVLCGFFTFTTTTVNIFEKASKNFMSPLELVTSQFPLWKHVCSWECRAVREERNEKGGGRDSRRVEARRSC